MGPYREDYEMAGLVRGPSDAIGSHLLSPFEAQIANAAFADGMEKAAEVAEHYHEMHHDVNDNDHEVAVAVASDIRSIASRFKE